MSKETSPSPFQMAFSPVSSTQAKVSDWSPNVTMQVASSCKFVLDPNFSHLKPRFGKRGPSPEPDGIFNQPPQPTKLMRCPAIYIVPTSDHDNNKEPYAICIPRPPASSARALEARSQMKVTVTQGDKGSHPATTKGLRLDEVPNQHLENESVAACQVWRPYPPAFGEKNVGSKPRLVTPVELELKPLGSIESFQHTRSSKESVTTCCSPSLAMMMHQGPDRMAGATKPAPTTTKSRRKLLARKPSVTFKDDIQTSMRLGVGKSEFWLSPADNSNIAKPRPIRLADKNHRFSSVVGGHSQSFLPLENRESQCAIADLFQPGATRAAYPSAASVASIDVVNTTGTARETQLQKAPIKARRSTTTYSVVPVAQNLLQAYSREENNIGAPFAFAGTDFTRPRHFLSVASSENHTDRIRSIPTASAFAPYGNHSS